MKFYTYQIGDGNGQTINTLVHSETMTAGDLLEAIAHAKVKTAGRAQSDDENTVRLLEETGGDSITVWVRLVKDL